MSLLSFVNLDDLLGVDRKPFVGVNYHAEQTGVGLDKVEVDEGDNNVTDD